MPPTGTVDVPLHLSAAPLIVPSSDDESIWTQILSEVSTNGVSNIVQGSVLFLGDKQSGKSCLVSRLEKKEVDALGSALEYHFFNVNTDYKDASYAYQLSSAGAVVAPGESVTVPLWILDGDPAFAPLIKFALTTGLSKNVVVLCASLAQPFTILTALNKWTKLLDTQIQQIFDRTTIVEARRAQELFWQEYVEPLDSSMHSDKIPSMETEQILLPLEQNVLTHNTGATIVVVLTKSDMAHEQTDEVLDRVQYQVRKFCMQHGAALVYTSAKEEKNILLLYKYLAHRVCGMPFTFPAQVVEKNAIFVPAGWDTGKKLDILKEAVADVERPLEVLRERQQVRDHIVEAEDDQIFLQRLANVEVASPKKNVQKPINEGFEGNSPLVSFFNNLLKSKEGQPATVTAKTVADPQAHLQRMLGQVNSSTSSQPATGNQSQQ